MFDFIRKKDTREKEAPESSEEPSVISQCSINGGLYNYSLGLKEDKQAQQEAMALAKEFMQIMIDQKIPYHTAMCLPDALHTLLTCSFYNHVFNDVLKPLPEYGNNQSDNRNDQGEN